MINNFTLDYDDFDSNHHSLAVKRSALGRSVERMLDTTDTIRICK